MEMPRDPFGGLSNSYKYKANTPVLVPAVPTGRPGVTAFPEKRTLDAPEIKTSSTTDRKKTNAQVCYTRVAQKNTERRVLKPGEVVFVSKSLSAYDGGGVNRRSVLAGLDSVNEELNSSAKLFTDGGRVYPLDDWRAVKTLQEWRVDGVLLGLHQEVVEDDALNVCVHGHCTATQMFDSGHIFTMDSCFLCLVAELSGDESYFSFTYVPCTSRSLSEQATTKSVLPRKKSKIDGLTGKIVGAWQIGKIVDTAMIKDPKEPSMTICVSVEWVGWRSLKERFPECGIADTWIQLKTPTPFVYSPCQLFFWPSRVQPDGELEAPSIPERSKYELKHDKHINDEDNRRCIAMSPRPTKRSRVEGGDGKSPKNPTENTDRMVQAEEEAKKIIENTGENYNTLLEVLQSGVVPESTSWYETFKGAVIAFKIKYGTLVRELEDNRNTTNVTDGFVPKLLNLGIWLTESQRNNSTLDENSRFVIAVK